MSRRRDPRATLRHVGWTLLVVAGGLLMLGFILFPIYFLVVSSLQEPAALFASPPQLLPSPPSLGFYRVATQEAPLHVWTQNSLLVVVGTVALTMPLAILAAYGISRFRFPGRLLVSKLILLLYMFPSILLLVPLFLLLASLNLVDSLPALVIAHATFALPFSIWFLSAYMRGVPKDLDEAALLDGCGRLRLLWHVILPIMLPGIAATAAFVFMFSWNEYAFAVTLVQSADLRTLPLGVTSYFSTQGIPWGVVLATSVLMSIPVVIIVLLAQRHFVSGLAAGAVKS